MATASRARAMREARRAQQFAKFRIVQLNLIPLVDTFVSIVFFALTTSTVGELTPVASGVNLPASAVGGVAHQELTLGIASTPPPGQRAPVVTLSGRPIMSVEAAAMAVSTNPREPMLIPALYTVLKQEADSIRKANNTPADQSVTTKLAIQGDRTMRYDLLARILQTVRLAGFSHISLQVNRTGAPGSAPVQAT